MAAILPHVPGPVKRPVKTYFPDGVCAVWVDQRASEAVTLVQFVSMQRAARTLALALHYHALHLCR